MRARVVALAELPAIEVAGVRWHSVRRALGISAFWTNAYSAGVGEMVVEVAWTPIGG